MTNQKMNLNIKPEDVSQIKCEHCGGMFFKQVVVLNSVPKLLVGAAEDVIIPAPTFRCDDCGGVNEAFMPKKPTPKKENNESGTTKSGLII